MIEVIQAPEQEACLSGCDKISVTYQLVGEEPVTVEVGSSGTNEGRPRYLFSIGENNMIIASYDGGWVVGVIATSIEGGLEQDTFCPFGTFGIEEGSIFESFSVAPCEPTPTTYAVLNEDCACPIGEYTTTEESPFSSFRVVPCDNPDYLIEYERIKVIDTTYQLNTRKRNGLFAQQVTAQRAYEYRSQLS